MNRLSHQRQLQLQQQQQMAENEAAALAAEIFDHFCVATTMRQILGLYRNMCDTIGLRPAPLNEFYPKLKAKIRSWKAQALWKKFDTRAAHRVYNKGNACTGTRVLVIGAGPCGLRTAIEAQLLGAKVVVVEKRDRISRNNVLHLWPFVITDLRNLGAKKFYGKFCAGSIDHISIRQLQCILLKVALLLGVEIHEGVSFISALEPSDGCGWRAQISPEDHAVSHYEFDVLIGADGKRNTLEGFKRKEFRGKLAIAITANFINKKTEAEAKAEEISGVAFIFNQSFFKELYATTGIDLENIVYYKDETHYFVMTAKKHSLIDKGVIIQDFADPAELLAPPNVNTDKLLDYAREAAEFSTKYQMPNLEFAVNHYGKPDVAMFDFTSMFAAETSCRVIVRKNYRLLQCLVGDSLLEPFWPTGSGCARGFLSSMDSAYAIKLWSNQKNSILGVLAQRESIYRLLAQTTPENLHRDIGAYTVDPATRYPNLNRSTVNVWQVKHLIDTDDKSILEQTFMDTNIQTATPEILIRRKRRTGDTLPLSAVLLRWIKAQLHAHEFIQNLTELSECFTGGKVLCALINRYRPDLVDLSALENFNALECNELAFKIFENELNIPRVMSAKDSINLENVDSKIWLNYLEQICEVFRGEIPHVKHPKLDMAELKEKCSSNNVPDFSRLLKIGLKKDDVTMDDIDMTKGTFRRKSVLDDEKLKRQRKYAADAALDTSRRAKKRRSHEKSANIEQRQQRLKEVEENRLERQNKRRLQRFQQTQNFYKSLHMLQANTFLRESDSSSPFEDYSIYLYRQQAPEFNDRVKELERKLLYPDRERGIPSAIPRGTDEKFSDRIKSMEQRITSRNAGAIDKKPKDLLRAIGKIESSDWNIREIEKKIEQSKKTETGKSKEKVPKWSKEQFLARQNKMSKPERQDSTEEKFKEIDQTLKNLDKQLKEGSILEVGERGRNKVASIAGQFVKKDDATEEKASPTSKSNTKVNLSFTKQAASEKCHFCKQTVYLMEKISTEGLILHRSCLKCHHCHTNLRLGAYAFDRDDPVGRFYCTQHFRLPAKPIRPVVKKTKTQRKSTVQDRNIGDDQQKSERIRGQPENIIQMDVLDRGETPERIEFENIDAMSDGEPSLENIIDENEWTDRNFISGSDDLESDLSSSDSSEEDSDSDIFEEANGSPIGAQTLQLATDWIGKQKHSNMDDSDDEDFYDSSEGLLDDEADSQTEGEEFKKAREMRREEVRLLPPPAYVLTDTETEVVSKDVTQEIDNNNKISTDNITDKILDKNNNKDADLDVNKIKLVDNERDGPTKTDIKIIERNIGRRVSSDIDALSENIYNLNNLIQLNKNVDNLKKENLVKNDIMKKLSLKEKWLKEGNIPTVFPIESVISSEGANTEKMVENSSEINLKQEEKVDDDIEEFFAALNPNEGEKELIEDFNERSNLYDDKDIGKLFYAAEHKFSPKHERRMSNTLKKIEIKNFSDTMDSIKAQITSPKISTQTSLDISKYFPNQKSEKAAPVPKNQNQKTLKDIDLNQYFPQKPTNQRKGSLIATVATKTSPLLRKSESLCVKNYTPTNGKKETTDLFGISATNKSRPSTSSSVQTTTNPKPNILHRSVPKRDATDSQSSGKKENTTNTNNKVTNNISTGKDTGLNLYDHLLDGAVDIKHIDRRPEKIVKKSPKSQKNTSDNLKSNSDKKCEQNGSTRRVIKRSNTSYELQKVLDANEKLFEQILQDDHEIRSPSSEYNNLFSQEKSPSEDISEKLEKILKEPVEDLKFNRVLLKRKKFAKQSKSLDDDSGNIEIPSGKNGLIVSNGNEKKIDSNESINKRNRKLSNESQVKRDSLTDFEKTMEYLKAEWRSEATNFLQNKRDSFYSKRKSSKDSIDLEDQNPTDKFLVSKCDKENMNINPPENLVVDDSLVDQILKEIVEGFKKDQIETSDDHNEKIDFEDHSDNEMDKVLCSAKIKDQVEIPLGEISDNISMDKISNEIVGSLEVILNKDDVNTNDRIEETDNILKEMNEWRSERNGLTTSSENIEEVNNNIPLEDDVKHGEAELTKIHEVTNSNNINGEFQISTEISANSFLKENSFKNERIESSEKSINVEIVGESKTNENVETKASKKEDDQDTDSILIVSPEISGNNTSSEKSSFEKIIQDEDTVLLDNFNKSDNMKNSTKKDFQEFNNGHKNFKKENVSSRESSSEEDSIEKLFSQFTDDMLVDVEFDSNDEIVSITAKENKKKLNNDLSKTVEKPEGIDVLIKDQIENVREEIMQPMEEKNTKLDQNEQVSINLPKYNKIDEDFEISKMKDHTKLGQEESREKFNENKQSPNNFLPLLNEVPKQNDKLDNMNDKKYFPTKPLRKNKSKSTSSSPPVPSPPLRTRKGYLSKLDPANIPPSVQEIIKNIKDDSEVYFIELNDTEPKNFPMKINNDSIAPQTLQPQYSPKFNKKEDSFINSTKRQDSFDDWEYIEQLERERRTALIERDKQYALENKPVNIVEKQYKPQQPQIWFESDDRNNNRYQNNKILSRSANDLSISPPKVPPRSPKSQRRRNYSKENINRDAISETRITPKGTHTSDIGISRSSESIPQRPLRRKSSTEDNVDKDTQLLLERSKMLHSKTKEFMNEKIVGNNPYLKRIMKNEKPVTIETEKLSTNTKSKSENVQLHFPTSNYTYEKKNTGIESGRRTQNLANTLGPRNFVEYFKRNPSQHKEHEPSKESCIIS